MAEEKKGGNKFMKYGLYAVGAAAIIAVLYYGYKWWSAKAAPTTASAAGHHHHHHKHHHDKGYEPVTPKEFGNTPVVSATLQG